MSSAYCRVEINSFITLCTLCSYHYHHHMACLQWTDALPRPLHTCIHMHFTLLGLYRVEFKKSEFIMKMMILSVIECWECQAQTCPKKIDPHKNMQNYCEKKQNDQYHLFMWISFIDFEERTLICWFQILWRDLTLSTRVAAHLELGFGFGSGFISASEIRVPTTCKLNDVFPSELIVTNVW